MTLGRVGWLALLLLPAASAPPPAPVTQVLLRATTTMTGQPITVPPGLGQVTISRVEIPPGGVLPMHKHPWPRYAYVESGEIEVRYEGSAPRISRAGEAVVEALDQWHEGRTMGDAPVRLIVFDQTPAGAVNVVRK